VEEEGVAEVAWRWEVAALEVVIWVEEGTEIELVSSRSCRSQCS
jgi:hypothetical protein